MREIAVDYEIGHAARFKFDFRDGLAEVKPDPNGSAIRLVDIFLFKLKMGNLRDGIGNDDLSRRSGRAHQENIFASALVTEQNAVLRIVIIVRRGAFCHGNIRKFCTIFENHSRGAYRGHVIALGIFRACKIFGEIDRFERAATVERADVRQRTYKSIVRIRLPVSVSADRDLPCTARLEIDGFKSRTVFESGAADRIIAVCSVCDRIGNSNLLQRRTAAEHIIGNTRSSLGKRHVLQ